MATLPSRVPADGNATTINTQYLRNLQGTLETLLGEVQAQTNGTAATQLASAQENPGSLDLQNLTVNAGGPNPQVGGTFDAAQDLITALANAGNSIYQELDWLQQALTDMISEINTTITTMGNTESLNSESAQTLIQDFNNTIGDITSPPVSGSSGSGSGSSSSSGNSGSNGSSSSGSGSGSNGTATG